MEREEALVLLHQYVKNPRTISHCLASEAVMRKLAKRLGEDPELWGLAGLLHDLDVEITMGNMQQHTLETAKILQQYNVGNDVIDAILVHNEHASHQLPRTAKLHHALACSETITGLITATALVYPDKKVGSVKPKSVLKRMKEKAFAASVSREAIMECETIGVPLEEFVALSVEAMQQISEQLGL